MDNVLDGIDGTLQEEEKNQRILIQKKEKKIKIIRTLTVIAYLISVSAVATILSAYYIFVWDPQTGNYTQTSNVEGVSMAFRIAEHERLTDHAKLVTNSFWTKTVNPDTINKLHTSTNIKSTVQTVNFSNSLTTV